MTSYVISDFEYTFVEGDVSDADTWNRNEVTLIFFGSILGLVLIALLLSETDIIVKDERNSIDTMPQDSHSDMFNFLGFKQRVRTTSQTNPVR
jgi:hypothetical protein